MRELYSNYFKLLGNALELTDMTMSKCCIEACKSVIGDYIDSRSVEEIDTEMLREFVDYVNRTQPQGSHNVIPLKNVIDKQD